MKMLLQTILFGALLIATILTFIALGATHLAPWILLLILVGIPIVNNRLEERRYVQWDPKYNTGIQQVDDEHKQLMSLVNHLKVAVRYHKGEIFEKQALDELVEYTKIHFAREEQLMRNYGYPDYERHKKLHDDMAAVVKQHVDDYEKRGHTALKNVAPVIRDWIFDHIHVEDQAYAKFLEEKGYIEDSVLKEIDKEEA